MQGQAASQSGKRKRAIQRLLKDWQELQDQPCRSVCAAPLEQDIFSWHGNLRPLSGPYAECVLHVTMEFGEDYPMSPPGVRIYPSIPHPNLFGNSVCLDMLKPISSAVPYTGWTTAYSVQSILLQLQAFLFAENIPQEYGGMIRADQYSALVPRARNELASYSCAVCGHTGLTPFPPLPERDAFDPIIDPTTGDQATKGKELASASSVDDGDGGECWLLQLPIELQLYTLQCLKNKQDILAAANTCTALSSIVREYGLLELVDSLLCYHSKRTLEEDILGVGISPEFFPNAPGKLKAIQTSLDLLSYSAYSVDGVRLSVWKELFQDFLPLVINPTHFRKAKPLILSSLANLAGEGAHLTWQRDQKLQARIVMSLLPKLMNSFVVSLMKQESPPSAIRLEAAQYFGLPRALKPSVMLSERALEGYCSFHHMLLALAEENPEIERMANHAVDSFLANPAYRLKAQTPDLGEWIINLTLARKGWSDVADLFLEELFIRNARWVLQKSAYLESVAFSIDRHGSLGMSPCLIDDSFEATEVSRRLIMFQVYFLTNIGRPEGQHWLDSLCTYNRTMGRPTHRMKTQLHRASKEILEVGSWAEFFDRIHLPRLNGTQLTSLLSSSIIKSSMPGRSYHRYNARSPSPPMSKLLKATSLFLEPRSELQKQGSSSSSSHTRKRSRSRSASPRSHDRASRSKRSRREEDSFYPLTPRPSRRERDEDRREDRRSSKRRRSRSRSPYRRDRESYHRSRRQRRDDDMDRYPSLSPRGRRERR